MYQYKRKYRNPIRVSVLQTSKLLKYGADANKSTVSGSRPLLSVIESRLQMCIRTILDYGAEIHNLDPQGWSPVHLACYFGSDIDIVETLLDGRISVDETLQYTHAAPLTLTAQEGHVRIVKHLIAQGADVNAINSDGETSLLIAISYKRPGPITLFLKSGVGYLRTTKTGENLLHYAAQFGDLSCLNALYAFDLSGIERPSNCRKANRCYRRIERGIPETRI